MKGNSYLRFGKLAPWYDTGLQLVGLPFGGEAAVREKVLGLLPLKSGNKVLEVGCGTGTVTLTLAGRVGQAGEAAGIDPSPEMLARALKKLSQNPLPQVVFLPGAGAPLPFSDAHFDALVFFLVLHEMAHDDRIDSLKEAVRVLKPGGHLLVGELARPESAAGRLLLRLMLLVEEEEATDFLRRGLTEVMTEGAGGALIEEKRTMLAMGLGQGVLYRKQKGQ